MIIVTARYPVGVTIIIINVHQFDQDEVCENRYQTKTPAVKLTVRSRSARDENWLSVKTPSFRYNHRQLLCWNSYTDSVRKTVSRGVFLVSKLRYIADIETRKLFLNTYIKPGIDYVVYDGCSDVLKRGPNFLHRRAVKLIFPDNTLSTGEKLKTDEGKGSLTMRRPPSCYSDSITLVFL